MSDATVLMIAAVAWAGLWLCLGAVIGWAAHAELSRRPGR